MRHNHERSWPSFEEGDEPMVGRRAAPRLRLAIPTKLTSLYGQLRCIMLDVSRTGAQISLEKPLPDGECAVIRIGGVEMFGCVTRCVPGRYAGTNGIEFDPPISDEEVLKLRAFYESIDEREKRELHEEARKWVMGQ